MDNFNKIISFVLGLVVVIVFFAVITGKINFRKGLPSLTGSPTASVTPTQTQTQASSKSPSPTPINYGSYKANGKATTIPATGLPMIFIPSLLAGALGGFFLRKTGRK